jgi:RNA polymerase sigma-70 factor (ECF subfamily)
VEPDSDELLERVRRDDLAARECLLGRHRERLRSLVALHMDPRLLPRVDPSDVVQEALAEADRRLQDYLRRRPMPFFPWLREMALERLAQLHRRHVRCQKRSVEREELSLSGLPDDSMRELADRLARDSASDRGEGEDLWHRLRAVLARLGERDREVVVLRHVEQLSVRETAAVLGISEAAVKVRHFRALERLRRLLAGAEGEGHL